MLNQAIYSHVGNSNPWVNLHRNDPIDFYLSEAAKQGVKGVVEVNMNQGKAVNPVQDGVSYLFTGSLCGCQGVSIIAKGKNGNPIAIMTHYPDDSLNANIADIKRLIKQNKCFMDEKAKPVAAFILPDDEEKDKMLKKLKSAIESEFPQGIESREILYEYDNEPDYKKKSYEYIIEFPKKKGELIKYQFHGSRFGNFGKL